MCVCVCVFVCVSEWELSPFAWVLLKFVYGSYRKFCAFNKIYYVVPDSREP